MRRRLRAAALPVTVRVVATADEYEGDFEVSSLRGAYTARPPRFWSAGAPDVARLSRWQRMKRVTALCAVVALVLLVLTGNSAQLAALLAGVPSVAGAPLSLTLAQRSGLVCLRDAAWSPDSAEVAFLGNWQECNPDHFVPALVNIADIHTQRVVRQIHPDTPILAALRSTAGTAPSTGGYRPQVISYHSILWSSDGQRLALTFLAVSSWNPAQQPYDGALIMRADGSGARVLLRQETAGTPDALYLVWDLTRGVPVVAHEVPARGSVLLTVAPALTYTWSAGGTLRTGDPITGSAPTLLRDTAPPGDPNGAPHFSIWQPGWLELDWRTGDGQVHTPGLYTWHTAFSAWSPDGRYLVDTVSTAAQLEPLGFRAPDRPALNGALAQLPLLPLCDAALEHVLEGLLDTSDASGPPAPWLAWRPDGRVLAVQDPAGVALYDCTSGRRLAVLQPADAQTVLAGEMPAPHWSPDGTHLLLPNGALVATGTLVA
ncbi:MAG: hypothetical protein ACHQ4H_11515 [Ktedonobacterales bacterium]